MDKDNKNNVVKLFNKKSVDCDIESKIFFKDFLYVKIMKD